MDDISTAALAVILLLLIITAAFFAGSETSMMAINRYRLRHMANDGHRGALLTASLLRRPDRLLGLILFGNNIVNFYAASLGVVITVRLVGDLGYAVGPVLLTFIFLIFAETAPKTVAAFHPEKIAFPVAYVLRPLAFLCYPFVWVINRIANSFLALLRFRTEDRETHLSREELRTVLQEGGKHLSDRFRGMLLGVLDLEQAAVEDVMIPRSEIIGIDLGEGLANNLKTLEQGRYTRLPLYRDSPNEIIGVLHARSLAGLLRKPPETLTAEDLEQAAEEPCFVTEGTTLEEQLESFRSNKQRLGFVVDEYGTVQGLVTLEDILEEIVGEFSTDAQRHSVVINRQGDGSAVIDGSATIREINRQLRWSLPCGGAKTLNGLMLERLETIPDVGTTLKLDGFALEVTKVTDSAVKLVRVTPLPQEQEDGED